MKLIDFMGKRRIAYVISILLTLLALGSLAFKHLNLGIDFTGGTAVELHYDRAPDLEHLRASLIQAGFRDPVAQLYGSSTDVLIHLQAQYTENIGPKVAGLVSFSGNEAHLVRAEYIGAQVGNQLRDQGGLGLLLALLGIMVYVALRFQWKFALGAVLALGHDVLIVIGLFSILGLEFDLTVMAGVLAVLGYSLNDTIVVYDRIRENIRTSRSHDIIQICNDAINQTLARTIATSGTTLLALCALYTMGGDMLRNFSLALIFGVVLGTFSSIYVAAALLVLFNLRRDDLAKAKQDNAP